MYHGGVSLLTSVLLGAIVLPDHAGSPRPGEVALGAGVEDLQPAAEVRVGVFDFLAFQVEGVWHPEAPLVGGGFRAAAGNNRSLYATAWAEGHLRPLLREDITEPLAGSDVAVGFGVTALSGPFAANLDGGVALGIPVVEVTLDNLDREAIDQQGGLFGMQRLTLALDLGDHVQLAVRGSFALPVDSVRFNRRDQDVLGTWDARVGGRVFVRF